MGSRRFSLSEALKFGFSKTFSNFGTIFSSVFLMFFVQAISVLVFMASASSEVFRFFHSAKTVHPTVYATAKHFGGLMNWKRVISHYMPAKLAFVLIITSVVMGLFCMAMKIGFSKIMLNIYDSGQSRVSVIFSCFGKLFSYIVASILYSIVVFMGFLFFIFPGIYFMAKFSFYGLVIADKEVGPIEALKRSAKITYGAKTHIIMLSLLCYILNMAAATMFGVGLIIVAPATGLAFVYAYRVLGAKLPSDECTVKL